MTIYRCYLLGEDGKIKSAELIESQTDADVLQEAERRLSGCEYPMIEVWEKARRIGTVGRSKDHPETIAPSRGEGADSARPKAHS